MASEARVAKRLYYDSNELKFRAEVVDIQLVAREQGQDGERTQLWRVALDRTAFYPESGGQPWDIGVLVATARSGAVLEVAVERVEEDEAGEVWHFVRKPLVAGTEVEGRIDATRRVDHMQQHSGQHLLSAVFLERLGARTVSFHLGAESSTIDLQLAEGASNLSAEQVAEVEAEVNRLIFGNRELRLRWYSREEAEDMLARGELRKLPERTGPMRVVEMVGVELNACGGTHVVATGAIGGLLVRRLEKVKQGVRVEFVCGLRAIRSSRREFELVSSLAGSLSVGAADVPSRVSSLQDETKKAAKERRALLEELAEGTARALVRDSDGAKVVQAIFTGKPVDFAKRIASVLASTGRAAVIAAMEDGAGGVAVALPAGDRRHAGELLREVAAGFAARGGGNAQLAQGVCEPSTLPSLAQALVARLTDEG